MRCSSRPSEQHQADMKLTESAEGLFPSTGISPLIPRLTVTDSSEIPEGSPPTTKKKRNMRRKVSRACSNCAKAHVACTDVKPCARCESIGLPCYVPPRRPRQPRQVSRKRKLDLNFKVKGEGSSPLREYHQSNPEKLSLASLAISRCVQTTPRCGHKRSSSWSPRCPNPPVLAVAPSPRPPLPALPVALPLPQPEPEELPKPFAHSHRRCVSMPSPPRICPTEDDLPLEGLFKMDECFSVGITNQLSIFDDQAMQIPSSDMQLDTCM